MKETIIIWFTALWPMLQTGVMIYFVIGLIIAYKVVGDLIFWNPRYDSVHLTIITILYMLFWPLEFFLPEY
jgi:hypothetical protein